MMGPRSRRTRRGRRRVARPYLGEHWPITFHPKWKALDNGGEKVLTSFYGYKRHRRGLAIAPRGFVLTSAVRQRTEGRRHWRRGAALRAHPVPPPVTLGVATRR